MSNSSNQSHYKIVHGATKDLRDVEDFISLLNTLDSHLKTELRDFFRAQDDIFVTRAPGRLDVMGGIADYSGSLVLEMPIEEATLAAAQRSDDSQLKIISLNEDETKSAIFEMPLADFLRDSKLITYEEARDYFNKDSKQHWAAYVAGTLLVLMHECGLSFNFGVRLLIKSRVPEGKGVSSSAALEVAAMSAVAALFNIKINPRELALLCQRTENLVVGAPCGVMDQMTSVCGEKGKLLALLCQPAELQGTITLPEDLAVWGLDSGVRHSVSAADYGSVRTGAFMGYRIIADLAGLKVTSTGNGNVLIEDAHWKGFLSNITPSEFESRFAKLLPEQINGDEFLARFDGTTDTVTRVLPQKTCAVRQPAAHAVYEHFRVRTFAELLNAKPSERRNEQLGELMYQSHASYSACGLDSDATDLLVSLVREAGTVEGLYGAKITGGGSGGTVAVLGKRDAGDAIERVTKEFKRITNYEPYIFKGSSQGCAAFGYIKLGK